MPFLIVVCLSRLARHLVGMLGGVQHGSQEHRLENHTGPNPRGKCLGFSKLLDTGAGRAPHRAAWQELGSLNHHVLAWQPPQIHWCKVNQPFTPFAIGTGLSPR